MNRGKEKNQKSLYELAKKKLNHQIFDTRGEKKEIKRKPN
jgi:hypothetical protein